MLRLLNQAGVDVFRLNFSHGDHAKTAEIMKSIRDIEKLTGSPIAVFADLQGPKIRTGVLKDGAYSAMISFVQKAGISFGLLVNGYCLKWIGYVEGAKQQSPEVARNLLLIGFVGGTIIGLAAMFCIAWYPVTRSYMEEIKAELAKRDESRG